MGKKQSKIALVQKHIAANPQATMVSVAKVTGVSYNYAYKINKALKETEAHALMSKDMDRGFSPSIAKQAETIYERKKDMDSVRAHVEMLAEQDRAKKTSSALTFTWPPYPKSYELSSTSDGSTASYYVLPTSCTELQHLISHKDMNAQIGEIFRSCYRYGESSHSSKLRDAKKIKFYIDAEIARLEG